MAGLHEARNMSGEHKKLMKLMMNDLGSLRREHISLSDYDENVRPVYHDNLERKRLVNQEGTKESEIGGKQKQQLSGWNSGSSNPPFTSGLIFSEAIHMTLGSDGTVMETLDDSSRGQAHRARLQEDPSIKDYKPDEDFLPFKKRGGHTSRGGLQSSRGGGRVSKHGRVRVPKNIDEGFQALTEAAAAAPQSKKPRMLENVEGATKVKWDSRLASPSAFMDRAASQFSASVAMQSVEKPATAGSNPPQSTEQVSLLGESAPSNPKKTAANGRPLAAKIPRLKMEPSNEETLPAMAVEGVTKANPTDSGIDEKMQQLLTMKHLMTEDQFQSIKAILLDTPNNVPHTIELEGAIKVKTASSVTAVMSADHTSSVTTSEANETVSREPSGVPALKRKPSEVERPSVTSSLQRAIIERKREETSSQLEDRIKATPASSRMPAPEPVLPNLTNVERGPIESVKFFKAGMDQNIIGERIHREHFLPLPKHTKPQDPKTSSPNHGFRAVSPPVQQFSALSLHDNNGLRLAFEEKTRSPSSISASGSPNIPDSAIARHYAGLHAPANRPTASYLNIPQPQDIRSQYWGTMPYDRSQVSEKTSGRTKGLPLPSFLIGAVAPSDPGAAARHQYGGNDDTVPQLQPQRPRNHLVDLEPESPKPTRKTTRVDPPTSHSDIGRRTEDYQEGAKEGPKVPNFLHGKTAPTDSGAAARAQYGMLAEEEHKEILANKMQKTTPLQSPSNLASKAASSSFTSTVNASLGRMQEELPMLRKKDPFARSKKVRV